MNAFKEFASNNKNKQNEKQKTMERISKMLRNSAIMK
jgi:hypothetical protein